MPRAQNVRFAGSSREHARRSLWLTLSSYFNAIKAVAGCDACCKRYTRLRRNEPERICGPAEGRHFDDFSAMIRSQRRVARSSAFDILMAGRTPGISTACSRVRDFRARCDRTSGWRHGRLPGSARNREGFFQTARVLKDLEPSNGKHEFPPPIRWAGGGKRAGDIPSAIVSRRRFLAHETQGLVFDEVARSIPWAL